MKKHNSCWLWIAVFLTPVYLQAQPETQITTVSPGLEYHPLVLQLGAYFASVGKPQDIGIEGLIGDHFSVSNTVSSNGLVGIGAYTKEFELTNFRWSFGLNAFYLAEIEVKGHVTQEEEFTNLTYQYNSTQVPIYLMAKTSAVNFNGGHSHITFDGGIGPNLFTTGDVVEQSLDGGTTIPDHTYAGKTTLTFGATAGVGIKMDELIGKLPVECGYRFFYLGTGKFTKLTDQLLHDFTTGNSYANALVCSLAF